MEAVVVRLKSFILNLGLVVELALVAPPVAAYLFLMRVFKDGTVVISAVAAAAAAIAEVLEAAAVVAVAIVELGIEFRGG